jgi:hypothetical protein
MAGVFFMLHNRNARFLGGLLFLVGCGDSGGGDGHASKYPSCDMIVEACHQYDDGSGSPASVCHDTAHDSESDQTCAVVLEECLETCVEAADGGDDAGDAN